MYTLVNGMTVFFTTFSRDCFKVYIKTALQSLQMMMKIYRTDESFDGVYVNHSVQNDS